MVNSFAHNQNSVLSGAQMIGVMKRISGMGDEYMIFYRLATSELVSVEIYIEIFSQKIEQNSFTYIDFENGFSEFNFLDSKESSEPNRIAILMLEKAGIDHTQNDYYVQKAKFKEFLYGRIYKMKMTLKEKKYEGLLYEDYSTKQAHLLSWNEAPGELACQIPGLNPQ